MIDYDVIVRVLGADVEARFGAFSEEASDLYDVPGLLLMAFERLQLRGDTLSKHVNELLDEWDAR